MPKNKNKQPNKTTPRKKTGPKPGTAKAKAAAQKRGRKLTKYSKKKHPELLLRLTSAGITSVTKLAVNFGIVRDTFYRWLHDHKEFREAYKEGSDSYLNIIARDSMKKLITGYTFNQKTTKKGNNHKGAFDETINTKKLIEPDPGMIKYYLNNKTGGEFKDRQEMDITSDGEQLQTFNIVVNGKISEVKNKKTS